LSNIPFLFVSCGKKQLSDIQSNVLNFLLLSHFEKQEYSVRTYDFFFFVPLFLLIALINRTTLPDPDNPNVLQRTKWQYVAKFCEHP